MANDRGSEVDDMRSGGNVSKPRHACAFAWSRVTARLFFSSCPYVRLARKNNQQAAMNGKSRISGHIVQLKRLTWNTNGQSVC